MVNSDSIFLFLSIIVYYVTEISIFSFLSDVKLPVLKQVFLLVLALFFNQIPYLSPLLIDPFLFLFILKQESYPILSLKSLFLAFAPSVFIDLLSRFIVLIIIPYMFLSNGLYVNHVIVDLTVYLMILPSFAIINYLVGKDYKSIFRADHSVRSQNFYKILLIFIVAYDIDVVLILGFTDSFRHFKHSMLVPASYKLLFLFLMLLLIYLLSYFNRWSKEHLKNELKREQQAYIANLETYGKHLEKLYKDIRGFQIDYLSRLEHLGQVIREGSVSQIQAIYAQTVHEANDYWDDKHYNISKLGNITMSSIKSLLSAKIISAEKSGITVNLEIPDLIAETPIPELDLLLLISIFCDNAIEAALEASFPCVSIAYFLLDDQQVFVVTNTTKEKVAINKVFEEGYSSKGAGRGIGLANAQRILQKYPQMSLRTKSSCSQFSQILTIPRIERS
ncbi:GHKL domain-containing protein [Streptococcus castoreus]|uniref:GHKL domain-containing protein n=1 Tax=Streptococcus castoreus TaxID=254786 RepID=UPI00040F9124|nr:GHKL domain-containing protein [Streptococcus castoreus]